MLGRRRRPWPNIETTFAQHLLSDQYNYNYNIETVYSVLVPDIPKLIKSQYMGDKTGWVNLKKRISTTGKSISNDWWKCSFDCDDFCQHI